MILKELEKNVHISYDLWDSDTYNSWLLFYRIYYIIKLNLCAKLQLLISLPFNGLTSYSLERNLQIPISTIWLLERWREKNMVNQERENQISCFLSIELQHYQSLWSRFQTTLFELLIVSFMVLPTTGNWLKEPDEEDDLLFFWESDEEDEQARLIKGFNEFSFHFQIP